MTDKEMRPVEGGASDRARHSSAWAADGADDRLGGGRIGSRVPRQRIEDDVELLTALGYFSGPIGRSKHGKIQVLCCPLCGHGHVHRADSPTAADGAIREAGCLIGYYVIRLRLAVAA